MNDESVTYTLQVSIQPEPYQELKVISLPWSVASSSVMKQGMQSYYSAVCWFAMKDTIDRLGGKIPLGGVVQSFGGTAIQQWSSPVALKVCEGVRVSGVLFSHTSTVCSSLSLFFCCLGYGCNGFRGQDSCLYNSQIAPYTLGPMQFKLVLWYQGESNACKQLLGNSIANINRMASL